ncbi:FANCD2 opposite strand protein isoform X1 [Enhydra lutris kenyoni]|nr:FANCD2 opposite strand protein isoform X1 [Enhydra lutris kenyoni]
MNFTVLLWWRNQLFTAFPGQFLDGMGSDQICCCYLLWEKREGQRNILGWKEKGTAMPLNTIGLSMAGYQLWSPWTPLDESFQWLRHTTPTPSSKHPFRASPCFPHTPSDLEVQLCFQEVTLVLDSPFLEPGVSPKLPCHTSELRTMNNKKGLVRKPQPVRLSGVDSVFGRVITAQPPKWTGTFRVSDKSAFCKIISRENQWPTGLKEPQIQMTVTMCKQMLRSILLLYATYKKCTFALQHSK